ncbi:hypothetical protein GJAV_G00231570 [Gymnothorax javanicus]|nr:hypothetical protein GJAV_G00231570 [Gymnothorax javanicus]
MDQMFSGFKRSPPPSAEAERPWGIVGKEEALQMEVEALAKLQRKRHSLPASSISMTTARLFARERRGSCFSSSSSEPEGDLIVFTELESESRGSGRAKEDCKEKLELEHLLLDSTGNIRTSRPPVPLEGSVSSTSNSGSQASTPSPCPGRTWTPPTPPQGTPFPFILSPNSPPSFQDSRPTSHPQLRASPDHTFFPSLSSSNALTARAPVRSPVPLVFPNPAPVPVPTPAISPEIADIFDKIASTSEYLKNGKCSGANSERVTSPLTTPTGIEWLDLDPLSMRKADAREAPPSLRGHGGAGQVGDPWDAVLLDHFDGGWARSSQTSNQGRLQHRTQPHPRMARRYSLNILPTSTQHSQSSQHEESSGMEGLLWDVLQGCDARNPEIIAFCEDLERLRARFPHDDPATNPGYILSPVLSPRGGHADSAGGVKVSVEITDCQEPVTFTCDVSSPVELLLMQALCWTNDDLTEVDVSDYVLKVCGREEVLQNQHNLGCHEHMQNCRKWETEIRLQLLRRGAVRKGLARTAEDDVSPVDLEKYLDQVERPFKETVTRQGLFSLLNGYHRQLSACLQTENIQHRIVDRVIHAVKIICCLLDEVETPAITEAVRRVKHVTGLPRTSPPQVCSQSPDVPTAGNPSPLEDSLAELTSAVYELNAECEPDEGTFFPFIGQNPENEPDEADDSKGASDTTEHVQFTLLAVYGITNAWVSSYESYYVMCALTHNGRNLFKPIQSKKVEVHKSFFNHIKWDELVPFPMAVSLLPLESVLTLSLYGILTQHSIGSPDSNKRRKPSELLGKVSMPLFNFQGVLAHGPHLLSLWSVPSPTLQGTVGRRRTKGARTILQVDFTSLAVKVPCVDVQPVCLPDPLSLEPLEPDLEERLEKLCSRAFTIGLTRADRLLLWDKRMHCQGYMRGLPKVLASAPRWDWRNKAEICALLHHWPPLPPDIALELLVSRFSDSHVRGAAVDWIKSCSDDELMDYLPQLVQALKFECHLKNALVMFLLSRALGSITIAHRLYWLLRDAVQDPCFSPRYETVLGALLCLCGAGLRTELDKQTQLVQMLGALAEKVRQGASSARQTVLQEGLEEVQSFLQNHNCGLPLCPGLVVQDLNIKACSFFSSNAVPLKIALVKADPLEEEVNIMVKVGEDMRQEMLAVQMMRIMDRVWLQEGLDLRIVNFSCISTGKDQGMVELVPDSETLRKIQVEFGVTGSFKDKPLAEWLRKHNPTEEEYKRATENFIYSCAGCCVATYVLGIGDRHNDNIMLRSTGHVFHIDFGKFLGNAQMFGTIKRDRAPFVLTSDMAYVINGGERPTSRFQLFVDLCCQAYNLIRKHAGLFLSLLTLMTSSGLPELTGPQDLKYVHDALQTDITNAEATIHFTRLIESSLGSVATKFNFFIHNLAQMRFSSLPSSEEPLLSFCPRTYTLKQDGRIRDASIFAFQKRYNPEKHYTYVLKVHREGQSEAQFISRTFDEFHELHSKLSDLFPVWKLPGFPNKMVLGRTHVKEVAAKRKVELNSYVHNLLQSSTEVTQCDLVYTFFHPITCDDKAEGSEGISKHSEVTPLSHTAGRVEGEVKLSISYRNKTLFIMVMHIKGLVTDDGTDPNPYVKTYLLPDPQKASKRKTKISRKTLNPTFNEMLVYSGYSKEILSRRELQLSVLSADTLRENFCLGGVTLRLKDFDLSSETVGWYKLSAVPAL